MSGYDYVVVGAGISGSALAYYLKKGGAARVLLLERGEPASGGTGKSAAIVRQQIYRLGGALYVDRLLLHRGAVNEAELRAAYRLARDWPIPELPIGGADVIRAGIKKGPDVGALIDAVESWWIARDFTPDREACLAELARLIAAR